MNIPAPPKNLTQESFLKYLQLIIALLQKLQNTNKKDLSGLNVKIEDTKNELLEVIKTIKLTPGEKGDVGERGADGHTPIAGIDYEIPKDGRDGKDGYTPIKNKDYFDGKDCDEATIVSNASNKAIDALKQLIPTIEAIEADLPKLGASVRDSLEFLQGDDRLKIEAIKDLREELEKLKKEIGRKNVVSGGGVGKHNLNSYDLSDSLNGVLKTFSLPAMWKVVLVVSNSIPVVFRPTVDYTWTSTSITFTDEITAESTLSYGQSLMILYQEI